MSQERDECLGGVGCKVPRHSPNSIPLTFKDWANDLPLWLHKLKYGKWYSLWLIFPGSTVHLSKNTRPTPNAYLTRGKPYTRSQCIHNMALSRLFPILCDLWACSSPWSSALNLEFRRPCLRHHLGLISLPLQTHRQIWSGKQSSWLRPQLLKIGINDFWPWANFLKNKCSWPPSTSNLQPPLAIRCSGSPNERFRLFLLWLPLWFLYFPLLPLYSLL